MALRVNMIMPQALAQVTFPVALEWAADKLEEPLWLEYCCQLLEMNLTRLMRFEQSKASFPFPVLHSCTWCTTAATKVRIVAQATAFVPTSYRRSSDWSTAASCWK